MARPKAITEEIEKQIIAMHKIGHGSRRISNAVGISKSSVHRYIQSIGITRSAEVSADPAPAKVADKVINKLKIIPIPHSHLINDEMLEQMKAALGYPTIAYIEYAPNHQKKCRCYSCSMVRKKNWIQLKQWADINVTRSEDNE